VLCQHGDAAGARMDAPCPRRVEVVTLADSYDAEAEQPQRRGYHSSAPLLHRSALSAWRCRPRTQPATRLPGSLSPRHDGKLTLLTRRFTPQRLAFSPTRRRSTSQLDPDKAVINPMSEGRRHDRQRRVFADTTGLGRFKGLPTA